MVFRTEVSSARRATTSPRSSWMVYRLACSKPARTVALCNMVVWGSVLYTGYHSMLRVTTSASWLKTVWRAALVSTTEVVGCVFVGRVENVGDMPRRAMVCKRYFKPGSMVCDEDAR